MNMKDTVGCMGNAIRVAAGHLVDLRNPDPTTLDVLTVAAALSKICRYGSHCPKFYTVAEHSVLATMLAFGDGIREHAVLRAILMHDAAEAYIGDVVKPLKIMLPDYAEVERRMEHAVGIAFGIDFDAHHDVIKHYDHIMLKSESTDMWGERPWEGLHLIDTRDANIQYWASDVAEREFLNLARKMGVE
jgi:5'-deoxynucleotidase YfbR-like HD superfamily hydrolase